MITIFHQFVKRILEIKFYFSVANMASAIKSSKHAVKFTIMNQPTLFIGVRMTYRTVSVENYKLHRTSPITVPYLDLRELAYPNEAQLHWLKARSTLGVHSRA